MDSIKIVSSGKPERNYHFNLNHNSSVRPISKEYDGNKGGAQIIVSQQGAGGKMIYETRHLKWKNGAWQDKYGNSYKI